jgi:PmbA protein
MYRRRPYDLQTAGQAKATSTGSGSAAEVVCSPSQRLYYQYRGGYLRGNGSGYQKVGGRATHGCGQGNILGREFSGNVLLGYKIENGKIVGDKNTMISGNVCQVLKDIV